MSHELRTPLTVINGVVESLLLNDDIVLIEKHILDKLKVELSFMTYFDGKFKYLGMLKRANETLSAVINDILDFSQLKINKIQIQKRNFDIEDAMLSIIESCEPLAKQKGIEFTFELDQEIPQALFGDVRRLKQILTNLISNAIKYTAKGGIQVRSRIHKQNIKTISIEFRIIDSGIGIKTEDRSKIFNSFTQINPGTSGSGAGLGLAIVKELIELMEGRIWFESILHKGTTFYILIEFEIPSSSFKIPKVKKFSLNQPLTILYCDDFEDNREIVKLYLKSENIQIDESENGLQALQKFQERSYDIIFMDLRMPIMDGFMAIQKIREIEKDQNVVLPIPIIAISAYGEDFEKKAYSAGCSSYLAKPYSKSALLKQITNAITS